MRAMTIAAPALLRIRRVAFLLPALVGLDNTLIVQEAPGATLEQELVRTNWPGLAPARLAAVTTRVGGFSRCCSR